MDKHHNSGRRPTSALPYASRLTPTQPIPMLMPYPVGQQAIGESFRVIQPYADIVLRGDHLAPSFEDSVFQVEVERTVAKIFGTALPHVVGPSPQTPTGWTDLLRASLKSSDFHVQPNGMYQCRVRGTLIEVSPDNYYEMMTGLPERLLQPLQNLSEKQRKDRVRRKLRTYIYDTKESLSRYANYMDRVLHVLDGEINGLDVNFDSIGTKGISRPIAHKQGTTPASPILIADTYANADNQASIESNDVSDSDSDDQSSHDSESETTKSDQSQISDTKFHTGPTPAERYIAPPNINWVLSNPRANRDDLMFLNNTGLAQSNNSPTVNDRLRSTEVNEILRSDIEPRYPEDLAVRYAAVHPDFDAESCGSDIPYKAENAPTDTTFIQSRLELETERPLRRKTISFSVDNYGLVPRLVGNYSEKEDTEGPAFVNALRDRGFTRKEIEEAYNNEFGASRTTDALYKRFKIRAGDQILSFLRNGKKRKLSEV